MYIVCMCACVFPLCLCVLFNSCSCFSTLKWITDQLFQTLSLTCNNAVYTRIHKLSQSGFAEISVLLSVVPSHQIGKQGTVRVCVTVCLCMSASVLKITPWEWSAVQHSLMKYDFINPSKNYNNQISLRLKWSAESVVWEFNISTSGGNSDANVCEDS